MKSVDRGFAGGAFRWGSVREVVSLQWLRRCWRLPTGVGAQKPSHDEERARDSDICGYQLMTERERSQYRERVQRSGGGEELDRIRERTPASRCRHAPGSAASFCPATSPGKPGRSRQRGRCTRKVAATPAVLVDGCPSPPIAERGAGSGRSLNRFDLCFEVMKGNARTELRSGRSGTKRGSEHEQMDQGTDSGAAVRRAGCLRRG